MVDQLTITDAYARKLTENSVDVSKNPNIGKSEKCTPNDGNNGDEDWNRDGSLPSIPINKRISLNKSL